MSRVYAESIDVQRSDDDPVQFLWRGRLYVVRGVLARWTEAGRWWRTAEAMVVTAGDEPRESGPADVVAPASIDDRERDYWRVEAGNGRSGSLGVFDLCFDWTAGTWFLDRALD
jgi:hypothetical protein